VHEKHSFDCGPSEMKIEAYNMHDQKTKIRRVTRWQT